MKTMRHGDVLVQQVNTIPAKAKRIKPGPRGYVIAEGEATGHAHVIADTPDVELYEMDGTLYCRVLAPVQFQHEEHCRTAVGDVPTIPPGTYRFPKQRVFDSGLARRVVD